METLERWLKKRALLLALLLALGVSYALGTNGVVSEDFMPFGDSEHYILHGMTLYGFLHSGQWSRFWETFTAQGQSLAPLHNWFFLLLPQSVASLTSYGVTQVATTYLLLALGVWLLCRALDRAEWTPAIFLLCASQNISLDYSFFYFEDAPFLALGTVVLAWQVQAWRIMGGKSSLLSGLGAGLMFWVKAPNAIIFAGTYFTAEIVRAILSWWALPPGDNAAVGVWRRNLVRHLLAAMAGFLPVTGLALACGAAESIVRLIDTNEVSGLFATQLECTGILRLLYFPLCLTFFYHAEAMAIIFAAVAFVTFRRTQGGAGAAPPFSNGTAFPVSLLLPLFVSTLLFGEFFSFGMAFKSMRFLLPIIPVCWLTVFWLAERWKVRFGAIFLASVAYAFCGFSQILFNSFETMDTNPESYQLKGDWLFRLPQCNVIDRRQVEITRNLVELIQGDLPRGGKVAVGTEKLLVTSESLTWAAQHRLALRGESSPLQFENFLTYDGKYSRGSLLHARGILMIVDPAMQYSPDVIDATDKLLQFCADHWVKSGFARMDPIGPGPGQVVAYLVLLKNPLTDAQITELAAGTGAAELPPGVEFGVAENRRMAWSECEAILIRWVEKKLGMSGS